MGRPHLPPALGGKTTPSPFTAIGGLTRRERVSAAGRAGRIMTKAPSMYEMEGASSALRTKSDSYLTLLVRKLRQGRTPARPAGFPACLAFRSCLQRVPVSGGNAFLSLTRMARKSYSRTIFAHFLSTLFPQFLARFPQSAAVIHGIANTFFHSSRAKR